MMNYYFKKIFYLLMMAGLLIIPLLSFAQTTVTGKVTSTEDGVGLPGVNVLIKGTHEGVVTDLNGNYSLDVPGSEATLVFSFIGMVSQEISVGDQTEISITLLADAIGLEEVVVVGYNTQKKVNLTGSVSTVSSAELDSRPITNMTSALSGLVAGVHVSQSDGQPGKDGATIRIRGIGTLNDASPLILVDGIKSSISDINPNDVESISILKDAASSAIYGSRAANGVILITTKKGDIGKLKVAYNGYYAWQSTTRKMDYISDFATYMEINNEAFVNVGVAPIYTQTDIDAWRSDPDPVLRPNVDWVDIWYGNIAPMHSHHFSFSGGTEKSVYNFSIGYLDQEGVAPDTWSKRYNSRMNWEGKISDKLKIGTNLSGIWKDLEDPDLLYSGESEIYYSMPGIPFERHPDGRYGFTQVMGTGSVLNPRAQWESRDDLEKNLRLFGKVYLNWEITDGLSFSHNAGIDYGNTLTRIFTAQVDLWNFSENMVMRTLGNPRRASNNNTEYFTITNYSTLNYNTKIAENHNLNILGGFSLEEYRYDKFGASIQKFHNNEIFVLNAGLENPQVSGTAWEWALMSWFGRINYDFKSKYLFEAVLRYDGSSRFKEGNKWGVFPSFSAAWRLSEENFMQDVSWLDNLKIRASWGKLGNQNISAYPYQTSYSLGQTYTMGGAVTSGIASTAVVNTDIKWESTTKTNLGIDVSIFGKLNITADYFHHLTDGILVKMQIPKTMGNKTNPVVNLAEVVNKGWELIANYRDNIGNLKYNLGFNITNVNNEVTKYQGEVRSGGNFVIWEGYAFRSMYGYVSEGLIRTQEELDALNEKARELTGNSSAWYINNKTRPGDIKYKDIDGSGVIDSKDQEIIGNTIPKYTFGFNLGLEYKGFDFSALLQGIQGRDSYLSGYGVYPRGSRGQIPLDWITDRYIPEDPSTWETARLPRVVSISSHTNNYKFSTFWKQDASFLRVKSIQLGYSLPIGSSIGFEKVRVFFNGENLFTFTKFDGYDPERSQTSTNITMYPLHKTISLGAQIMF